MESHICNSCGKLIEVEKSGELCKYCGKPYDAPLEKLDVEVLVGTKWQGLVLVTFVLSVLNLLVGPCMSFLAMFSPMLSAVIFKVIPFKVCFYSLVTVPFLALFCVILKWLAKREYKTELHSTKNFRLAKISYRLNIWTVLCWLLIMVLGMGITLYNLIRF